MKKIVFPFINMILFQCFLFCYTSELKSQEISSTPCHLSLIVYQNCYQILQIITNKNLQNVSYTLHFNSCLVHTLGFELLPVLYCFQYFPSPIHLISSRQLSSYLTPFQHLAQVPTLLLKDYLLLTAKERLLWYFSYLSSKWVPFLNPLTVLNVKVPRASILNVCRCQFAPQSKPFLCPLPCTCLLGLK